MFIHLLLMLTSTPSSIGNVVLGFLRVALYSAYAKCKLCSRKVATYNGETPFSFACLFHESPSNLVDLPHVPSRISKHEHLSLHCFKINDLGISRNEK